MVKLTELSLRDGHQSILATRMRTDDMVPILSKMDQVGFWAVEMWGGATYDVPIRYLNEKSPAEVIIWPSFISLTFTLVRISIFSNP